MVRMQSPTKISSVTEAAAGVAAALDDELRRVNFMPAISALEAMLTLDDLEEVLALLIVSHWSLLSPALAASDGAEVGALLLEELEKLMFRFSVAAAAMALVETLGRLVLFEVRLPSLPCRTKP